MGLKPPVALPMSSRSKPLYILAPLMREIRKKKHFIERHGWLPADECRVTRAIRTSSVVYSLPGHLRLTVGPSFAGAVGFCEFPSSSYFHPRGTCDRKIDSSVHMSAFQWASVKCSTTGHQHPRKTVKCFKKTKKDKMLYCTRRILTRVLMSTHLPARKKSHVSFFLSVGKRSA